MPSRKNTTQSPSPATRRPPQYLIARRIGDSLPANIDPMSLDLLTESLKNDSDIDILEQIEPPDGEPTFLVLMSDERASSLKARFGQTLLVERDEDLEMFDDPNIIEGFDRLDPGLVMLDEQSVTTVSLLVKGRSEPQKPVVGATVYLIGQLWPIKGITDNRGRVRLELLGETLDSIKGLYVKPTEGFWSFWLDAPQLSTDGDNLITLAGFNDTHSNFPQTEAITWGHQATGLTEIKAGLTGTGIRIGIIDSGMATTHPELQAHGGFDFTASDDPDQTWQTDTVRHGSHVAGTIVALANEQGIRGFAPDAETHVMKVFPGGKFSDLIKSLDKCISLGVDVVNLSLGSKKVSDVLAQKFHAAKQSGVACFAAAGNNAAAVNFPALLPTVFAVAAVGKQQAFPSDSYHAKQVGQHSSADGQYFSARFTCFGEQIDVCAPGVAVLSTVPDKGYSALDGTSMACPHVVGLAALLLQNREDIKAMPRNAARVDALFQALRSGSRDLGLPAAYQGAGMPTAQQLGLTDGTDNNGDRTNQWENLDQLLKQALGLARKRLAEQD